MKRLSLSDYNDLLRRGLLAGATIRGGPAPDETAVKKWSNAKPQHTLDGMRFRSKTELLVWNRLCEEFGREAIRRDVRMPLVAGVTEGNKTLYMTVDFAVVRDGRVVHWLDAKTNRKSRDWARGKAMFEATWGKLVEWDGRGDLPDAVIENEKHFNLGAARTAS